MEFVRYYPNSIEMMWCLHVAMYLFVMHCAHAAAQWAFDYLEILANGHSMPFVSLVPVQLLTMINWLR